MTHHAFTFYADPGHGWLKVTLKQLSLIGMKPQDFSSYSYRLGDAVYLEEDADATKFLHKWKEQEIGSCIINHKHTDKQSRIRSYERINT